MNSLTASVRAEGLEPSSSFEQWHLKPSRLPISPRPRRGDRNASSPPGPSQRCAAVRSRGVHPGPSKAPSPARADRSGDHRGVRLPGAGLVAVDQVSVRLRLVPEPRLRAAMAAVRVVLCVRLPQIRSLRRGTAPAARHRRRDGDTRRAAARAAQAHPQPPDDPALREYNRYLAELAAQDAAQQNRTTT